MYQLAGFKKLKGIQHAFSEVSEGNMSFNWGPDRIVSTNRKKFFHTAGVPSQNCIAMSLEHGTRICSVSLTEMRRYSIYQSRGIVADCLMTSERGLYLFVLTGDCLPVLIYCPERSVIALAHISRNNAGDLFVKKIIAALDAEFGCHPESLVAGFGPAIHGTSYLHSNAAEKKLRGWQQFINQKPDGRHAIDFIGYTRQQMIESGVLPEKISSCGIDTAVSQNFYSHYRSGLTYEPEGRFATVLGMV